MLAFKYVVLATCCIGICIGRASSNETNHKINYHKINEYLERNLGKSDDNQKALSIAAEWLQSLEKTNSGDLINSLRLFVSLEELADSKTCNARGHKILSDNNEALTELARYGIRAVDRVALEYSQTHANVCCRKYEENFNRKRSQMDAKMFELVKSFAKEITEYALEGGDYPNSFGATEMEEVLRSSPINYIRLMDDGNARKRNRAGEAGLLREYLQKQTGAKILSNDSLRMAYKEYLEQPCQEYVSEIGPDVYQPVILDEITRLDSRGKVADCDGGSMDYRLGLAYHKVCEMYILGKDNILANVMESIK